VHIILTKNEMLRARNASEQHRLAVVRVDGPHVGVSGVEFRETGFSEIGTILYLPELLTRAREPH
jgi:hypothetical protein